MKHLQSFLSISHYPLFEQSIIESLHSNNKKLEMSTLSSDKDSFVFILLNLQRNNIIVKRNRVLLFIISNKYYVFSKIIYYLIDIKEMIIH